MESLESTAPRAVVEYAFKPSLVGAPLALRLTPTALEWSQGRPTGCIPYERIRRVRLSFRPVSMQSQRFVAEIWAEGAPKLTVSSSSWRSIFEQERLDAAYGTFVRELSRRVGAATRAASFESGSPPILYWIGLAAFVVVCLTLAALTTRALQIGALAAAAMVAGFLLLFLWQVGTFFRRNRPGRFDPDRIPAEVLPPGASSE